MYVSTPPTKTENSVTPFFSDLGGNIQVNLATAIRGEDSTYNRMNTAPKYSFTYISTATTTVVKSAPGLLSHIVVEGGTAGTIVIYNNTAASGAIVASFDSTNALKEYPLPAECTIGITVVTSAATKLTVFWL